MKITKWEARQLFYEYLVRVNASVEGSSDRSAEFKSRAQSAAIAFRRDVVDHRGEIDIVFIITKTPTVSYQFELVKRAGRMAFWLT